MSIIKSILNTVYRAWCVISFLVPFLLFYPFFLLFTSRPAWYKHAHTLNRIWSWVQLRLYFLPVTVEHRGRLQENQRYIFTPNHSSFIDIPLLLQTIPGFLNFVGKSSLAKVPLWGPIYNKLYITVDRRNPVSSARSYIRSKKTVTEENRNLAIFPEGTISEKAGEEMLPFKDGPFKLAIETQIPVVPVSMPFNHIFLPDVAGKFIVNWHPLKLIIHEPIETKGLTLQDIPFLKNKVYEIINAEFIKHKHDHRYTNHPEISPLSPSGV
ncbi:lysophospholipid acyltransferase family protein [Adhaeribacter aquaticus]|uniref:lysophospholipid acyltransferase family protein n=1 Tax=Adhaeribacter aquaticus TaxID=299567 RepID=UPI000A00D89E|nr:lysophospholipid acyltransferase family protein [Adhaeribacter aquaticus]